MPAPASPRLPGFLVAAQADKSMQDFSAAPLASDSANYGFYFELEEASILEAFERQFAGLTSTPEVEAQIARLEAEIDALARQESLAATLLAAGKDKTGLTGAKWTGASSRKPPANRNIPDDPPLNRHGKREAVQRDEQHATAKRERVSWPVSDKEIQEAQNADDACRHYIEVLQTGAASESVRDHFTVANGLLWHHIRPQRVPYAPSALLIFVPAVFQQRLLQFYHGARTLPESFNVFSAVSFGTSGDPALDSRCLSALHVAWAAGGLSAL